MKISKNSRGFTLIEIVAVVVILSILGSFTFVFIENAVKTYTLIKQQYPLYADGTYIMERIVRELNDASAITIPAINATSNNLEFRKVHTGIDSSQIVSFTLNDFVLLRNTVPIGKNIKGFSVSRGTLNGPITVEITLGLDPPYNLSIPDLILRTTVIPNNYGTLFNGDYYEAIQ